MRDLRRAPPAAESAADSGRAAAAPTAAALSLPLCTGADSGRAPPGAAQRLRPRAVVAAAETCAGSGRAPWRLSLPLQPLPIPAAQAARRLGATVDRASGR